MTGIKRCTALSTSTEMDRWPLWGIPLQIVMEFLVPLPMYILVCLLFDEPILKDRRTNVTCLKQHGYHALAGISVWFWYGMFMLSNRVQHRSTADNLAWLVLHFLLSDGLYYFFHRLCHVRYLYSIHAPHHTHKSTPGAKIRMNALSGTCTHFLDMMITGHLPVFLPCFVTQTPPMWMVGYVIFINFWICAGHSMGRRVGLFPSMGGLFVTPEVHGRHHIKGRENENFGILLTVWDRVMGTYLAA